ncbi:MAG: rhodanese-like domain-containing protein [Gammaproteobacteria bacterium]
MKNNTWGYLSVGVVTAALLGWGSSAMALDVNLTETRTYVNVIHEGQTIRVQRIQDEEHVLTGAFAKTSRKCPPFCIHPMQAAPGVTTVGETEIFDFMEGQLRNGTGVLIDARTPSFFKQGTIPGSVNIPFTVFTQDANSAELAEVLQKLGARKRGDVGAVTRWFEKTVAVFGWFNADMKTDKWDFSEAKELLLWCNGPWCDQSPRAIKGLLKLGYPPEKLFYYRGGMQNWLSLGLTTVIPGQP